MVRHKSRWLVVRIDVQRDVATNPINCSIVRGGQQEVRKKCSKQLVQEGLNLSRKDIYSAVRDMVRAAFGIRGIGIVEGMQVHLYDSDTQLTVLKLPREACGITRAAITLLTSIANMPVVASTISVHGSARTAKMSLSHHFIEWSNRKMRGDNMNAEQYSKLCSDLNTRLDKVKNMD